MRSRATVLTAILALSAAADDVLAQGSADLRYAAPFPGKLVLVSVDTSSTENSVMTTGLQSRTVMHLSFAGGADGTTAMVQLQARSGVMTTPMGEMPLDQDGGATMEVKLLDTGPARAEAKDVPVGAMGSNPAAVMSAAVGQGLLPYLPGRMLHLGETWVDTMTSRAGDSDFAVEATTVTRGTYVADTLVDGRMLNVVRITSERTVRGSGTIRRIRMEQATTTTVEETVLWDSGLHYPVWRSTSRISETVMSTPDPPQTTETKSTHTTVTTASPLEPGG